MEFVFQKAADVERALLKYNKIAPRALHYK